MTDKPESPDVSPRDDTRPTDELIRLALSTEDDEEYWHAVYALQWRGTQDVFDAAKELCTSDDPEKRSLGAGILGSLGAIERSFPMESVDILLNMLSGEEDVGVLSTISYALGHQRDSRAVEPLVEMKNHPDPDVREAVTSGLAGSISDLVCTSDRLVEIAVDSLIELSTDPNRDVRDWATFHLGYCEMSEVDSPAIRTALWQRVDDEDPEIRAEALVGLALRRDRTAVDPLIRELARVCETNEWWDYIIEAATELPDQRMCIYLECLRDRNEEEYKCDMYDKAIAACKGGGANDETDNT